MAKLNLSILICLLPLSLLLAQENQYINYTVDDGLPSNMVYGVAQDDRGFMWFGTDSGLSRYDGYEFTNYSLEDGLPDTEILNFFKDSEDRIWFYTLNGKIGFVHNDSIFNSKNTKWLRELDFDSRITSIVEVDKKVYITAIGSTYKVLSGTKVQMFDVGESADLIICYCNEQINLILQSVSKKGIYKIDKNVGDFTLEKALNNNPSVSALTYPLCFKNNIYAFNYSFTINGVIKVNDLSFYYRPESPKDHIQNIKVLNGELYILTMAGILKAKDKNRIFQEFADLKFTSSMFFDSEGNAWYTSIKSGIHFEHRSKIKLDQRSKNIDAISLIDDFLYVAHNRTIISKKNRLGKYSEFLTFNKALRINFIEKDPIGRILVGRSGGLFFHREKITSGQARSITFADSTLYVGSNRGIKKEGTPSNAPYPFKGNVLDIHAVGKDSILVGTEQGILVVNGDSIAVKSVFKTFSDDSLLQIRVNKMIPQKDHLWIATGGNGLLKFSEKGNIEQFSKKDGLTSNMILDFIIHENAIWAVTQKGLNKITENEEGFLISALDQSDGLNSFQIEGIEYFNDSIHLAANDGLYSIPADIDLTETNQFDLYIDKVWSGNSITNESTFDSNTKSIRILFKALVYRNHKSLLYQYQLHDNGTPVNEKEWQEADLNEVNFLNLSPGKYSFLARAKTKNSDWSDPVEYQFEIKPAFWQTRWFPASIIMLILTIVIAVIIQINRSRLAKKNLEKAKVSAELTALKAQINPHFLFNVLNSIQLFILENKKDIAQEYLHKYGKLMRMVLDHSDHLIVPLKSELEMLGLYTDLEMLRLKKGFDFEVITSDYFNTKRVNIPSMIIQPFVENAIWHGLSPLKKKGKVTLKMGHKVGQIVVSIADNGVGFDNTISTSPSSNHNSSGVRIVKERLDLIHNSSRFKNHIKIESTIGKGTTIKLTFSDALS
ncbi:sensor histidine kinase [Ekhidna sp.]